MKTANVKLSLRNIAAILEGIQKLPIVEYSEKDQMELIELMEYLEKEGFDLVCLEDVA